jgi:hypothetical protein
VATVKEIAKAASARGWWDWEEEASGRAATDAEVTEELSIWRDLARGRQEGEGRENETNRYVCKQWHDG